MATLRRKHGEEENSQEENGQTSLGLEDQIQETNSENSEKVVVKKKRVVKVKAEEGAEGEAAPTPATKRNGMNKRPYSRSYPTPSGEASESIVAEAASSNEDNANKPRLLINDLTIKSMPELRELAMQYGFTAGFDFCNS